MDGQFLKAPTTNNSLAGLMDDLNHSNLTADLSYLYGVYQDSETGNHGVFYRGNVIGEPPSTMRYFALDALPFDQIRSVCRTQHVEAVS